MKNLADRIFNEILNEQKIELSEMHKHKFLKACQKAVELNRDLTYSDQKYAARIYLNYIQDFPDLTL